jgi:branched-chain amino acid transport system permease protein
MILQISQAVVSGVLLGGIICLVAIGLSLIWGVMDVVNFAQGEFVMLAMYVTLGFAQFFGLDPILSMPLVVVVMACTGVLTYQAVIKPVVGAPLLMPVLATFGLSLLIRYTIQGLFSANFRVMPQHIVDQTAAFTIGGLYFPHVTTIGFVTAILCTGALWFYLSNSETGRAMRAVAQDREAAAVVGINVERIQRLAWAVGIGLTGVAGALLSMIYQIHPGVGPAFTMLSFAAVALGGLRSIIGPAVAAIVLGVVQVLIGTLWKPEYQDVVIFGFLIVALIILAKQGKRQ